MRFSRLYLNRLLDSPTPHDTIVVIDVLRSFTSAAVALARGARAIYPVESISEAVTLHDRLPNALSVGAVGGGDPIPGFDFGNTPSALLSADVAGRDVVMSTAAGVRGLQRFSQGRQLFAASLVCARATAHAIRASGAEDVCFIITGDHPLLADPRHLEALLAGRPANAAIYAQRVRDSDFGRRFTAGTWPNLPAADLDLAAEADRYNFAMPVHHENGHLVIRASR